MKVDKDTAQSEFERFAETMDLDLEPAGMDDEDAKSFASQKNLVIRAMQKGDLVINESGEPEFTPSRSADAKTITFYEPTGATMQAMDRRKASQDVSKTYAAMADMTRQDAKRFSQLKYADLKVCLAVFTLYTG